MRHQEVLGSAPHRSSRATTGEGRVRLACDYVGVCVRAFACTPTQWAARRSLCLRELNTGGCFERSMVEHRSRLPSPRAERGAFWMVCRLLRAMQLRKVSGERNTVPERIPRSVSGRRTRAQSGGYAWGAAETTLSRASSATGAGALSFLEDFPPLGSTTISTSESI